MKHRPAWNGQRLTLMDWQVTDLEKMLGSHAAAFNLFGFLADLDTALATQGDIMPPSYEMHRWLQHKVVDEAERRGLPVMGSQTHLGKLTSRMAAALAKIGKS